MFQIEGLIFILFHVSFAKRIFKFRNVMSFAYATMWDKFRNFILIKTSVINKIVGYSIHARINPFTVGNQFINLNSSSDI